MVLLGTLYPLLADALDLGKISVGPPYFALLFVLLMAPLVLLLPFGPLTRWQREQASKPLAMLVPWAGLALGVGVARVLPRAAGRRGRSPPACRRGLGRCSARCASSGRALRADGPAASPPRCSA